MIRISRVALAFVLLFFTLSVTATDTATTKQQSDLLLILDGSGSMWEQIEGEDKIVIARRVLKDILGNLTVDRAVGLMSYGHRRKGDCEDIETLVPIGPMDKAFLGKKIDGLSPRGRTPIANAVTQAFDTLKAKEGATTVVLVSDGVETCGADPCKVVQGAKDSGIDFVMHVVGFDLGEAHVAQLECAAQAGGGLYLSASNANDLAAALNQTVTQSAELPSSRISIKAMADGEFTDVAVQVLRSDTGERVGGGRTYTSEETNPRVIPVAAGTYDVAVQAVNFKGMVKRRLDKLVVEEGATVERSVDFSAGKLQIEVRRNEILSDATVNVFVAGTKQNVAGSRTYAGPRSNPVTLNLTEGEYDIAIRSVEITGGPELRLSNVSIKSGEKISKNESFSSGTLRIGAVQGNDLADATIQLVQVDSGQAVGGGRTYTHDKSNPKVFEVVPGVYRVKLKAVKLTDRPTREFAVTVKPKETVEHIENFAK